MLTNKQVLSIATDILFLDDFILGTLVDTTGTDWLANFTTDLHNDDIKLIALMIHTGDIIDDIDTTDYRVLDDLERDEALNDYADNYYQDIILPEIPQYLQWYFDEVSWKSDYLDSLDSGEALSSNGYESEVTVLDETFYIYEI